MLRFNSNTAHFSLSSAELLVLQDATCLDEASSFPYNYQNELIASESGIIAISRVSVIFFTFHETFRLLTGSLFRGMKTLSLSHISSGPLKWLPSVYIPKLNRVRSVDSIKLKE